MAILKLIAQLGLDKTGFDAGMAAAGKQVNQFGAGLKSQLAGAFSAAAVTAFVKSIIDTGSEIKDLSDRLGVSAKDVQEFGMAAKLGGQDADVFARSLEKIRLASSKGGGQLGIFGVTPEQMAAGVPALRQLAIALESFSGDPSQTSALADVFGSKGMGQTINMLRELKGAGSGTLFFSDEDVENADRFGDAMTKVWNNIKVFATNQGFAKGSTWRKLFGIKDPSSPEKVKTGNLPVPDEKEIEIAAKAQMATQDRLLKMEAETADITERNRVSQLSNEERINELIQNRIELQRQLQFALTDEEVATNRLKTAKTDAELIALTQRRTTPAKARFGIEESALGRVGAFTGAAAAASVTPGQAQQIRAIEMLREQMIQKGIAVRDVKR